VTTAQLGSAIRDLAEHGTVYLERRPDAVLVLEGTRGWTGGRAEMSRMDGGMWRVEWVPGEVATRDA